MFKLEDLFEHEVRAIFAGLLELPGKVCNPILQKLDPQFGIQLNAYAASAAQATQADPTSESPVAEEPTPAEPTPAEPSPAE